jgi:predicted  nucleic acid-binding Zn-ribbon protein
MSDDPFKPNDDPDSIEKRREASDPLYVLLQAVFDKLVVVESRQGNIEQGIINLGTRLEAVESEIDNLKERIAGIDARFTDQLQSRLDSINEGLASLRADTEKGFRAIDRQMDSLSGGITRLHAEQRDLHERIDGIERKAS